MVGGAYKKQISMGARVVFKNGNNDS